MQIEATTCAPCVAREHTRRDEIEMIFEPCARIGKKPFEHPAHREDCRAGIDRRIADVHLAHFAAGCRGFFEYADTKSLSREICRRSETAHSGADDCDVRSIVPH